MKECQIIICDNSTKQTILKRLTTEKKLVNLKFFSWSELKKKLFFDYDNEALEYVIKSLNVSLSNAKMYLDNIYFLQDIDDEKVKFLNALKSELEEKNLLIKNNHLFTYLKNKPIQVYAHSLTKEQQLILQDFNYELINNNQNFYEPKVYEAKNMNAEVAFVLTKIGDLLHNNVDISSIKIIATKEYYPILRKYFNIYHLPINIPSTSSFYSTMIMQEFLSNYDTLDLDANILNLTEHYSNVNDLITIINKSVKVKDQSLRKEFIIHDAKNTFLNATLYKKGVSIQRLDANFTDNDYVFCLGFNMGSYPKIYQDDDYLNDKIKQKLGRDTSSDKNNYERQNIINALRNIKNLTITYKLNDKNGKCYPSNILEELNLPVEQANIDITTSYSYLFSSLEYAKCLDLYYKYNEISQDLSIYQNNLNIAYKEYNNNFTGIDKSKLKQSFNGELTLSYTTVEKYNECAFKYYLSNILKLDINDANFKALVGSITHKILQLGLVKDIDIKKEIMAYVKTSDYKLNSKEMFYLQKLSSELELILNVIKEQSKQSKLDKYLFEYELFVYKDLEDLKITFKGLIDKVMYALVDNEEVIAIVDYKTGNTKISLDNTQYGLDMQLPIYLYLLKTSERFKEARVGGFYIQKVLDNIPTREFGKTYESQRKDNLKLSGYSNKSEHILSLIDKDYAGSWVIKGLKLKNDGEFASSAKVLSSAEMDEMINMVDSQIDIVIDNILCGKFMINPKVIKGKNKACEYCKFKDICYKTKDNEVILGGVSHEVD